MHRTKSHYFPASQAPLSTIIFIRPLDYSLDRFSRSRVANAGAGSRQRPSFAALTVVLHRRAPSAFMQTLAFAPQPSDNLPCSPPPSTIMLERASPPPPPTAPRNAPRPLGQPDYSLPAPPQNQRQGPGLRGLGASGPPTGVPLRKGGGAERSTRASGACGRTPLRRKTAGGGWGSRAG